MSLDDLIHRLAAHGKVLDLETRALEATLSELADLDVAAELEAARTRGEELRSELDDARARIAALEADLRSALRPVDVHGVLVDRAGSPLLDAEVIYVHEVLGRPWRARTLARPTVLDDPGHPAPPGYFRAPGPKHLTGRYRFEVRLGERTGITDWIDVDTDWSPREIGVTLESTEPPGPSVDGLDPLDPAGNGWFLSISLYGLLGAPLDAAISMLDDCRENGWRNARVWLTWADGGIVHRDGTVDPAGLERLRRLLAAATERGMSLDLTTNTKAQFVTGSAALARAWEAILPALEGQPLMIDVANEATDDGVTTEDVVRLTRAVKGVRPDAHVTASTTGSTASPVGRQRDAYERWIEAGAQIDWYAPHELRTADWPSHAGERLRAFAGRWPAGRALPVHSQEPGLEGDPRPLAPDDWRTYLTEARAAGARGANLMGRFGFDLRDGSSFRARMNATERRVFEDAETWLG